MRNTLIILLAIIFSACGQVGEDKSLTSGELASARVIVSGSKSRVKDQNYSQIYTYRVEVSGPGIDQPIVKDFAGDSESGTIDGIPVGKDRVVKVQAINTRGKILREGETENVAVGKGVNDIGVSLDAVPIFTNLQDGNVIPLNRLVIRVFSDPEDLVQIKREKKNQIETLNEFNPDMSTGLFSMTPKLPEKGEYTFIAESKITGRSSTVTVRIIDGINAIPASVYSSGYVNAYKDEVSVGRVGSPVYSAGHLGSLWPVILEQRLIGY